VLLVEDNLINQSVAQSMLDKLGLQHEVADDGAQAVRRVRATQFDLVLMDCQMPVMDGYAATAAIRALPDGRGARLPIIALTANAMQGDRQACLDAGMNGFLAKPYTLPSLQAVLQEWLPARPDARPGQASTGTRPAAELPATTAINMATIETLRALEEPGSTALITHLLTSFLSSADEKLARVCAAVADGQATVLSQTAHSMKSSAATLGAEALADCYRNLEKCGREQRTDDARDLLEQTRLEQARAARALRGLLESTA
jgi:CheY-like chemotaxis protein/HPt (histidine-containing phosphotransfer) domain-containing protein